MPPSASDGPNYRPACMVRLGLLPPYSVEDVKRAFRELAKEAHPDGGGDAESFGELHAAYQRGLELAGYLASRRKWLADRVDRYLARSEFVEQIEQRGGHCRLQNPDAYQADFGDDFAEMLCELVAVHLTGEAFDDAALAALNTGKVSREIRLLDLSGSRVTDDGLRALSGWDLFGLDLRDTPISRQGLETVLQLPRLEWLHVGDTQIGMWNRFLLRRTNPNLEIVTDRQAEQPDFDSPIYRQAKLMQRLADE